MRRKKHKSYDKIQIILIILCTLIFLVCAVWLLLYLKDAGSSAQQAKSLKQEYILVDGESAGNNSNGETGNEPIYTPAEPIKAEKIMIDGREYPDFTGLDVPGRKIDFAGMQRDVNPDIYAWVYVPGTKVDYPILQSAADNGYYLNHDSEGERAACGSIFTEDYNNKDFNDNHTVIYGHNMKNGTMFRSLRNYDKQDFFTENKYIYIYTADETRVYEIFGAYEYTDEHLLLNYETENRGKFQAYLDKVKNRSDVSGHYDREMSLNGSDKIITLSTCIGDKANSRYLVQAKLIAAEAN